MNQGPNGAFVYVVGPGDKAVNQPVNVVAVEGAIVGDPRRPEARPAVVTDGQMSLKRGSPVSYGQHGGGGPGGSGQGQGHGGHGRGGGQGGRGPGGAGAGA